MAENDSGYGKLYELFDGSMEGCTGAACGGNCCREKTISNTKGQKVVFNTVLESSDERDELRAKRPDLKDLGVRFQDTKVRLTPGGPSHVVTVMRGCLGEAGCKLGADKPMACRIFPFRMQETVPVDVRCPNLSDIVREPGLIEQIAEVREGLGYGESGLWREAVRRITGI